MSVYTKRPFNTRREENNLLNIQQNPLSANNQQPHNNKIQLRVERVTANPPSPSWPEQPPEAPRGKNAPLSLQRPLRYASVLLLTSRQFNFVHMAPGQETCLKEHNCKMMTRNQSLLYSWSSVIQRIILSYILYKMKYRMCGFPVICNRYMWFRLLARHSEIFEFVHLWCNK